MFKTGELTPATLAELCLGHLAEDPDHHCQFMGVAGYSPDGLRQAIGTEQMQHGLID